MDVKNARRIYRNHPVEALVSDDLITASDEKINEALTDATPGTVIYNAGMSIIKQKNFDGSWVTVVRGVLANNNNNISVASDEEVESMLNDTFDKD